MPRKAKAPIAKERSEQRAFVRWFALQYPGELLAKNCNDLVRNERQAFLMALEGLLPGMPDVCIMAPRKPWHSLFIELKRRRGGIVSDAQKEIIARLNKVGYLAIVCYGWDEARNATIKYMQGERW